MQTLDGKVIRGYELRELIGKGGFAAVYRAYQPTVEREVAVKVILAKYANDPEFVRRFEAEAQLIARLEHLHIVPLYDYWREPNNAYLVMRWLRGGNLFTSIQKNGCWEIQAAAQMLEQIAAALAVAHRHGIIHRDLTPANILLDEEKNAYLADFGIAKEAVSVTREERLFGSPAYMAPEQIKIEPITPQTDIYSLGIVLYETLTGKTPFDSNSVTELLQKHLTDPIPPLQIIRPDLPHSFNQVIMRATAKNPVERFPDTLSMATAFRQAIRGTEDFATSRESPAPSPVESEGGPFTAPLDDIHTLILGAALEAVNPYKGLRPFEEADAMNFFGRNDLIHQLLQRMADETSGRFVAVVGPSGSGKSSVVKAGLIPAIRHNGLPNSERWFVARMVPGAHPFQELENALLGVTFDSSSSLIDALQKDENGLFEVVRRILPADHTELVLLIDQFEEIFTLVHDEAERALFLRSLLVAVTRPRSRLRVILTLRADFYDRPLLYSGFGELFRQRTEVVLPLSPDELQEAIEGPASRAGLEPEPGLIAAMIADVTDQPGALPLLQFALTELYERREGRKLTLQAYRASGGVLGALARRAEDLYREMDDPQKDAARQLFLRLIRLGDGTEDTRRRVRWAELISIGSSKAVIQTVLEQLGKYRLLTFDRDPQTREPTVEIAHEALIREWQLLREWLNENRDDLRVQQRLTVSTTEWLNTGRDESFLASGARLTQFEALMTAGRIALNENEQAYVRASIAKRRRAARRVKMAVATLIVATVGALILALYAFEQQNRAQKSQQKAVQERDRADSESRISRSRELAATALNNQDQIDLSLLLSLEALKVSDTLEARHSLFTALEKSPYLVTFLRGHTAPVRTVAFSPDGLTLASAGRDGTILLWDVASQNTILPPLIGHTDAINSLTFSPDGEMLASASDDGTVRLWNVKTGEQEGEPIGGHTGAVWSVAISSDGKIIATGGEDGLILLHETTSGELIGAPLSGHSGIVYSVAFSPDGRMLASGGDDFTIRSVGCRKRRGRWRSAGRTL